MKRSEERDQRYMTSLEAQNECQPDHPEFAYFGAVSTIGHWT